MVELYSIEQRENYYQESPLKKDGSWAWTDPISIDEVKFKEHLQTMPSGDKLTHYNRSFKIVKDANSIRISFFDYRKESEYIRGKHQMEKTLSLDRYIIKPLANNFYVSTTTFSKRKRRRSITQNYVKSAKIFVMSRLFASLLYKTFGVGSLDHAKNLNLPIPDVIIKEINRMQKILINELDIADVIWSSMNMKPFQSPKMVVELEDYLFIFFNRAILSWFCKNNNIKVSRHWLYDIMREQYVIKKELARYDNDYLSAILDYYKLNDDAADIIEAKFNDVMSHHTTLTTLSVWEKIFDKKFIIKSNILSHLVHLNHNIFKLNYPEERRKFQEFLVYLAENKEHIISAVERNMKITNTGYEMPHDFKISGVIVGIARLYRMGVMFDFTKLLELLNDTSLIHPYAIKSGQSEEYAVSNVTVDVAFNISINNLLAESGKFLKIKLNPLYKKRVEKKFKMFGENWELKIGFRNTTQEINTLFEVVAHLTNLTTNHSLEIVVTDPNVKNSIRMNVNTNDLISYVRDKKKRNINIDFDKLGFAQDHHIRRMKGKNLIIALAEYQGKPMKYRRKSPTDDSSFVHLLRKVYELFYSYTRMFTVDYQVLYPILDYQRKQDEVLNKYTYIKS